MYHGHTLTSKITFNSVIQVIDKYAFVVCMFVYVYMYIYVYVYIGENMMVALTKPSDMVIVKDSPG